MSSDQPHVELSFELALSDVLAAQRSIFFRSMSGWVVSIIGVVLGAAALVLGSWSFALEVGLWLVVMGFLLLYLLPRRSFLANPSLRGRQRWVIGPDGLSFETTASDGTRLAMGERDWRSVVRTRETSRAFLVYSAPRLPSAVPKRVMEPSQVADIRALLAANVTKGSG
jgi:membrane protein implicated in regulation of membrane protease activity